MFGARKPCTGRGSSIPRRGWPQIRNLIPPRRSSIPDSSGEAVAEEETRRLRVWRRARMLVGDDHVASCMHVMFGCRQTTFIYISCMHACAHATCVRICDMGEYVYANRRMRGGHVCPACMHSGSCKALAEVRIAARTGDWLTAQLKQVWNSAQATRSASDGCSTNHLSLSTMWIPRVGSVRLS